jgi:hypothetical protein
MSCEQIDLKAYSLGEATKAERKAVEGHAASCAECSAELESLGTLQVAMRSWADEEPARRIAFVSDKVFEPRWWQKLNWAQMLASAAMAALVAFAVVGKSREVPAGGSLVAQAIVDRAPEDTVALAERVQNAVRIALAESEARHKQETVALVQATERRMRRENAQAMTQTMAMVDANFEMMRKREARYIRASADLGTR